MSWLQLLCKGIVFLLVASGTAWLTYSMSHVHVASPTVLSQPNNSLTYNVKNPCGPMSVSILLQLIDSEGVTKQQCFDAVHCNSLGLSSVNDLLIGLRDLGFAAKAVSLSDLDLMQYSTVGPVIAYMAYEHFVTIMVTPNRSIVEMDAGGAKVVSMQDFTSQWGGVCIVCKPSASELETTLLSIGLDSH